MTMMIDDDNNDDNNDFFLIVLILKKLDVMINYWMIIFIFIQFKYVKQIYKTIIF